MIGILYRYPHPNDSSRFIYVGQTQHVDKPEKRDRQHRRGSSTFGKRFKKKFPDKKLPEPIKEQVEIFDQTELNELEIIWMFRYHTWRGYPDGMNIILPGTQDYKAAAILGGQANVVSGHIQALGRKQVINIRGMGGKVSGKNVGRRNVESGQLAKARALVNKTEAARKGGRAGGLLGGMRNVETGWIQKLGRRRVESGFFNPEHQSAAGKIGGKVSACSRYYVGRGKPCICGRHPETKNENP